MQVEEVGMAPVAKTADQKYCVECAALIRVHAEICPTCGVRQPGMGAPLPRYVEGGRSRIAAALFAIFLGGIGGHKFYLGQPGMGILYLAFFWTFIPTIIAFVEFILLLTMTDEAFDARYNP